jgi:hypothetical protein
MCSGSRHTHHCAVDFGHRVVMAVLIVVTRALMVITRGLDAGWFSWTGGLGHYPIRGHRLPMGSNSHHVPCQVLDLSMQEPEEARLFITEAIENPNLRWSLSQCTYRTV